MRVALAQINVTVGDLAGNASKIAAAAARAKSGRARLVVFPELALTGYPPEDLLFRADFVDANLRSLRALARRTKGIAAVVGFVDRKEGRLYNAAALLDAGRVRAVYRKTELPNYGVFDEKRYFSPGPGRTVWPPVAGSLVLPTICEDIWIRSSFVYGPGVLGSAPVILNLSASPFYAGKQALREKLVTDLARRSRAAVVYVNLVGGQDELVFDGGSVAVSSSGRIEARAKRFAEDIVIADLDSRSRPRRQERAQRPVRSSLEEEVYSALVLGTRDYVEKNRFKSVVIGLSGGIDSALVARIAVDALGPSRVLGVTMPSPYSSEATLADAKELARRLGIRCAEIPIKPLMIAFDGALRKEFSGLAPGVTEENLQARIRGNILMALSNKLGHLVLTTGNKSEMATGYCTLYGDMAGGFAVIKDVPKTLVFRLARWRNYRAPKNSIPETTLRRAPSAELRAGQKDQDTLPPYPLLDRFLAHYVERHGRFASATGVPRALGRKLARMVDANEYKRRQAPPGVKITPLAFGRDRRMPLTNAYRA